MAIAIQRSGTVQNAGDREEDFLFVWLVVCFFFFFSHTESRMPLWSGGDVAIMGEKKEGILWGQELGVMVSAVLLRHRDSSGIERPGSEPPALGPPASKLRFASDLMEQFSSTLQRSRHCEMDCNTNPSFSISHPKPPRN